MSPYTVYLAGPMRGLPKFNFPAFYEAERAITKNLRWRVFNPARADEDAGFDPTTTDPSLKISPDICEEFFDRDVQMIKHSNGIIMLPGWEDSIGACAEFYIAKWLQKDIHFYNDMLHNLK